MPKKKYKTDDRKRLQILCTSQQEEAITKAAADAGLSHDRSAFVLAHALAAAKKYAGGIGAPILITGELADRIRAEAELQGVPPESIVMQWSITGIGNPTQADPG